MSVWGELRLQVTDCSNITISMNTTDGSKVSTTIRLTGVVGLECVD